MCSMSGLSWEAIIVIRARLAALMLTAAILGTVADSALAADWFDWFQQKWQRARDQVDWTQPNYGKSDAQLRVEQEAQRQQQFQPDQWNRSIQEMLRRNEPWAQQPAQQAQQAYQRQQSAPANSEFVRLLEGLPRYPIMTPAPVPVYSPSPVPAYDAQPLSNDAKAALDAMISQRPPSSNVQMVPGDPFRQSSPAVQRLPAVQGLPSQTTGPRKWTDEEIRRLYQDQYNYSPGYTPAAIDYPVPVQRSTSIYVQPYQSPAPSPAYTPPTYAPPAATGYSASVPRPGPTPIQPSQSPASSSVYTPPTYAPPAATGYSASVPRPGPTPIQPSQSPAPSSVYAPPTYAPPAVTGYNPPVQQSAPTYKAAPVYGTTGMGAINPYNPPALPNNGSTASPNAASQRNVTPPPAATGYSASVPRPGPTPIQPSQSPAPSSVYTPPRYAPPAVTGYNPPVKQSAPAYKAAPVYGTTGMGAINPYNPPALPNNGSTASPNAASQRNVTPPPAVTGYKAPVQPCIPPYCVQR